MDLVDSWILAWALTYLSCAFIKPDIVNTIGGWKVPRTASILLLFNTGVFMAVAVFFDVWVLYLVFGVLEAMGCVASFTGVVAWRLPYARLKSHGGAQITMALMDLVASALLLSKAF